MKIRLKKILPLCLIAIFFEASVLFAQTKPEAATKSPAPTVKTTVAPTKEVVDEDEAPVKVEQKEGVTVYTLPQAIKQALIISPSIDSAKYDLEFSQAQLEEANNSRFFPKLDLNVLGGVVPDVPQGSGPENNFPPVNGSINNIGPFMQVRMDAFQPIYSFGKISNLRRAALIGVNAKAEGVEKAKNELVMQVKKTYNGLTSLYSLREFLLELQGRSGKAKDIIDKQIQKRKSDVTEIDLMRVQVFQAETDRRLIDINNNIDFLVTTLKVLMGLPREAKIDIADQRIRMDNTSIGTIESYIQIAKQNRPDIAQLEALVQAREAGMKATKALFAPTLGLAGFYRYGLAPDRQNLQNPFLVDEFNNNTGGGFLVLNQNLGFHITNTKYKQAKAQYDKAVADQQRALQGIELEIRRSHTNAVAKQQSVEAAKRGFKTGRSWVLATTLNFGIGVTPPKDLIEAFVGYSTVKINYLQALNDYFTSLADLSNAVGQEVTSLQY